MGFFAFIFVFLLGGVVSLVGAAFAIHYTLLVVERKTDSQRQKLAKEVSAEESQRAVQLLIPELKTKVRFSFSTAPWPKEAAKRMQHTTIVLKANMFFHFVDEKRDACNIARVDNCAVDILRQDGKPKFNKKNYIRIVSPAGNLFPDAATSGGTTSKNAGDTCYIKFFNGKDLEQWYYALKSATSLTITKEPKEVELLQAQQRYFAHLTAVANNSAEVNADWTNALLGRIFWGVHNHPVFLALITEKLQKKMAKLKKPKFVESISVTEVGFGPNLPLFSNIKILSLSPQGSLAFDGDVYYHGGFNLMIDINLRIDLPIGGVSVEVPIRASVLVKAFAGRGHIQVAPPPAKRAWIGFYGEPRVDLDVKIEVGKNLSLVNIPSIANIVINKIKQQLIKKLVLPAMDDWPLPHIPSTKTAAKIIEDTPAGSEKDHGRPGALLASAAEGSTTASSLNQSSSTSSPVLTRVSSQPERTTSVGATSSSSLSTSSSSVSTKRHSVAAMPGHSSAKAPQPITVRTRTSPRERVSKEQSSSTSNSGAPPLPARTQSALTQALNQPESPLVETGSPVIGTYKPLMTMPSTGASPLPTREGTNTITSLQLPSSPPRGQWNSTDEWYQNSLLALRDRDSSDSDGSDREDERQRAEREKKQKEDKEKEDRERKLKEEKEKEEQEKQRKLKEDREREEREKREKDERERKAREEKERLERERAKEDKDRAEEERARREREGKAKSEVITPLTEDTPTSSSEDMREIEQFTNIGKSDDDHKRESEEKERKEREEAEKREAKEQQEKEQREKEERERLAQQEQREKKQKEEQERQERSGTVTKHEVFSDPLSSSLNNPIMDEIFGSGDDSPPPRRQATFDGNIPSPLLPDAPHRRRSGSLTTTAVTAKPPALPPRAHEQQVPSSLTGGRVSQPRPVQQSASKFRTTSHMFEDFDFSFPSAGPVATGSPTLAPHAATPPTTSFLGLNTPVTSSSPPSPPRPSTASNTDNLFSFSPPASSASSTSSVATKPGAPPKKAGGLFNLDMDDLFNKVEKQHHLVEKFKAAKTRAQNAINEWNHTNPDQDL